MCRHIRRGLVCPSPLLLCLSACGIVSGGRCSLGTFKASRVQDCRPRRPLAPAPAALFSVCLFVKFLEVLRVLRSPPGPRLSEALRPGCLSPVRSTLLSSFTPEQFLICY